MTAATSDTVLAALVTASIGATAAGDNVVSPRTWRTPIAEMPILMWQAPSEEKTGHGRSGAPSFTCLGTFRVVARIYLKVAADDAAANAALAAVGLMQRQLEVAIVNNTDLRASGVQAFDRIRVVKDVKTEGELVFGELVMDFMLEFYQAPEDFYPIDGDEIEQIGIYADFLNLFSPTGDFTGEPDATPFVADAEPSPRTSGPDGRAEGAVVLTDLQD